MKSIHENFIFNTKFDSNIFTTEVLDFIKKEGYKLKKNDSYNEEIEGDKAFKIYIGSIDCFDIYIYIGLNGIAIDLDYDCGGNSSNIFFKFYKDDKFEYTYDRMVDYLNTIKTF